jgi:hypothetical protein
MLASQSLIVISQKIARITATPRKTLTLMENKAVRLIIKAERVLLTQL